MADAVLAKRCAGDGRRSFPGATVARVVAAAGGRLVVGTANVPFGSAPPEQPTTNASARTAHTTLGNLTRAKITRTLARVAEPFAPLINDQRAALLGVLSDMPADGWDRVTICDPWTVKDVGAHLVELELQFGRVLRGEADEIAMDNDEAVERWRRVDGDTVRYSIWHHGSATQRVIDTRPDDSWSRGVTHSGQAIELRRALPMHLFELAVHAHDITAALGVASIWGERAGPLVGWFVEEAPRALALTPASGAVEVRVHEGGAHVLDGRSGEWLVGDDAAVATARWETDAETLLLATTGRLPVADALARSTVEGDRALLEAVLDDWQLAR